NGDALFAEGQTRALMPGNVTVQSQRHQRRKKVILLLASLAFSAAAFLTMDSLYSAALRRTRKWNSCRVSDPVLHHVFKPNCSSMDQWGKDSYQFYSNSLGFRDERVRQVPLADVQPRILMLGDSFTEGMIAWRNSYVGMIAAHFPQYDFLNGGVASYSPSNYLNVTRKVLAAGVEVDEVIVFIDISDVQDEAAFYRDVDTSGAVTHPAKERRTTPSWYSRWRS